MNESVRLSRFTLVAPIVVSGILVLRLWSAWCAFPLQAWNEIRLAPSFMLAAGINPYPALNEGPVTTWIYGPIPLFVYLPAAFTDSAGAALLVAGGINIFLAVAAVWIGLSHVLGGTARNSQRMVWAALLVLAAWPGSSLQYIQADNLAVLLSLASNALLSTPAGGPRGRLPAIAAAACAALAVASKQTFAGLVLGQLIWLLVVASPTRALRHGLACTAFGLLITAGSIAWFGAEGLWLNLVELPLQLPYWASPADRAAGLAWHLAGYVLLPALVLLAGRRRVWRRESPWLLPALAWICLLPTALLACFKLGGTANSLHVFLLLLPVAVVAALDSLRARGAWTAALFLLVASVGAQQSFLRELDSARMAPATHHLDQGAYLARELAGEIYFPWNPLVTYFQERRFYHVEDGLYVRVVAGYPPDGLSLARHLPPAWSVTAFRGSDEGWGIIGQMQPAAATTTPFGSWTLHSWPKVAPMAPPNPAAP